MPGHGPYRVPRLDQSLRQMRSDEPGRPGDQHGRRGIRPCVLGDAHGEAPRLHLGDQALHLADHVTVQLVGVGLGQPHLHPLPLPLVDLVVAAAGTG